MLVLDIAAFLRKPATVLVFLGVLFLVPLIRSPRLGVYADAEQVRVRNSVISLTVPWSEVSAFATRRSQAFTPRKVTEVLWIDLLSGERYPMVGVWRRDEIGLADPQLVSATAAMQLLHQLEERHRAAVGEIAVG